MTRLRTFILAVTTTALGCGPAVGVDSQGQGQGSTTTGNTPPLGSTQASGGDATISPTTSNDETATVPPESTGHADETTSTAFLPPPDGGTGACSVWEQDCPRGQKCTVWAEDGDTWTGERCVPVVASPDAPGEPCTAEGPGLTGIDTCDVGSICFDLDPRTLQGLCTPFCSGSPNAPMCEDPDRWCPVFSDAFIPLCLLTCNPLQDDCPEGQGCYPSSDGFTCFADASGDAGGVFEPCEYTNACAPGSLCLNVDAVAPCLGEGEGVGVACCTPYCSLEAPSCPAGTECFPAFPKGSVPPELEDVGICATDDP